MVVSKDSKRKRKESPPPIIESSPEMPKRTKVQAQRKFAQGQSAPTSSYSSALTASTVAGVSAGPSASASDSREPPTEILPNKRPKTEDFLTFLCFRGTNALPAHLDFLNQNKGGSTSAVLNEAENDATSSPKGKESGKVKDESKSATTTPKSGKTSNSKKREKSGVSVKSSDAVLSSATVSSAAKKIQEPTSTSTISKKTEEPPPSPVMTFAVRKRAELVPEGTRRGRVTERVSRVSAAAVVNKEKCNKTPDGNRRSIRTNPKDIKSLVGSNTEDELSDSNDVELNDKLVNALVVSPSINVATPVKNEQVNTNAKAVVPQQTNTPVAKGKKGKVIAANAKKKPIVVPVEEPINESKVANPCEVAKESKEHAPDPPKRPLVKEKILKRVRQKEAPIFVPSPEPTGRMTRQRAFFEPVKVPRRSEEKPEDELEKEKENVEKEILNKDMDNVQENGDKEIKEGINGRKKAAVNDKESNSDKLATVAAPDINIFDFSSEDEQPLAKTIKLKKPKSTANKKNLQATKAELKKETPNFLLEKSAIASPLKESATILQTNIKTKQENDKLDPELNNKHSNDIQVSEENQVSEAESPVEKPKVKGKKAVARKKTTLATVATIAVQESAEPYNKNSFEDDLPNKSTPTAPQHRKKPKREVEKSPVPVTANADNSTNDTGKEIARANTTVRPSRKTKEAATIYMGIIGQKLQQDDDDDKEDELSINSFPDLPNVKEMEKMEIELKKNLSLSPAAKSSKSGATTAEKSTGPARRGRPPKIATKPPKAIPAKREIEGVLRKKDVAKAIELLSVQKPTMADSTQKHGLDQINDEDEDFLLNEEVNETKRKLEKSFSDSDDEPLAIKLNKASEKDSDYSKKSEVAASVATPATITTTIPIANREVTTPSSPALPPPLLESKSAIAPAKMLNFLPVLSVPTPISTSIDTAFKLNKVETDREKLKLLTPPAVTPSSHIQPLALIPASSSLVPTTYIPPARQASTTKSPQTHPPLQHVPSPIKYQTPPTTYPPPIEAYPSPKINPNFLTPKFDRNIDRRIMCPDGSSISTLPRQSSFPSPSPVKVDMSSTPKATTTSSPKTPAVVPSATSSSDPLKDEIGSILAANLMPSKEESGKIFGIASVSLAQSSGPDNTKCTLGKCGSIHRPALGPVVPTESYLGEQLSSKERRKAKVNMTHEQIQKWLIECSSNPDEIQDDLDDDFDDNLRPNLFATTPPPTRDDKESTSFSSSSKTTRDLGKSESAWSGKGPSLKATPVVVSKEDNKNDDSPVEPAPITERFTNNQQSSTHLAKSQPITTKLRSTETEAKAKEAQKPSKRQEKVSETKANKKTVAAQEKEKPSTGSGRYAGASVNKSGAQHSIATNAASSVSSPKQQTKKKNSLDDTRLNKTTTQSAAKSVVTNTPAATAPAAATPSPKTQKRTPVYNSKLKETTTTSHKKKSPFSYAFGAFSADNEKSIYSFDKDDDVGVTPLSKPSFRRQSQRDSQHNDEQTAIAPVIAAATAAATPSAATTKKKITADQKDNGTSQNNSVSLTLSPEDNSKLVKVSMESEKRNRAPVAAQLEKPSQTQIDNDFGGDSDSEGHTFYIPLQGNGVGGANEGIHGVAVKLGREGPDGPNQKVVMHATLVTKAQMGANSKPLPDSMNVSEIVKNLLTSTSTTTTTTTSSAIVNTQVVANSALAPTTVTNSNATAVVANCAASAVAGTSSATVSSSKSVPVGTVQPRFKSDNSINPGAIPSGSGALTRVNSSSSLFSGSNKSRGQASKKIKDDTPIKMCNNTAFPRHDDPTQMVEAPIFRPTEKEFQDPMEFIERITPIAARFGICKIIPPASFKPECRVSDDMRFTAYNQYVHKMLHRWGPSVKELSAIKKYLGTQSIVMNHPPWIGGMEVDLPRLYHTVQELGGLKEVIEKKKWARVAEEMCIPKLAQDRVTKLDDIYCKYLLPYDTLSPVERQKLFDEVEADWAKREARARRNADRFVNTESVSNEEDDISSEDDDESEEEIDGVSMECIVKGRSMPLSQFFRIARNTMALWFKNTEPTVTEVEAEFWRHVAVRDSHVCVHSGSIDSSGWGYGFPTPGPKGKGSTCARHPWNLKVLTNNAGSVLRSLGPVMGVTVPTLHVGMLFSACCWYRDPHGLSWIEYLHTGATKLWYGIPDDQSSNFRSALTSLIPTHCQNKTIWLPCDTVMVPPHMLTDRGVSLCRIEQKPGEYVVIFPRAYTSSVATGYVVSESVYFATSSWLELAKDDFRDIHDSCEPAMFSLEQLLFALGSDQRVTPAALVQMLPMINEVFEKETAAREQLKAAGVTSTEKISTEKNSKSKKQQPIKSIESECDLCRANLYISMVKTDEGNIYCLQHALKNLNKGNIQAKQCTLIFTYNIEDIENLIRNLKDRITQKRCITNKKSK